MNGNSLLLGRVYGIPIKVSYTLLFLLPFIALNFGGGNLLYGLVIALGLFTSIALHELGHSLTAMRFGTHVQEIELGLLGGAARMYNIPSEPKQEILVALAGPAVSLILGILGILSPARALIHIGIINIALFLFNIIPCFPMDGGRVLRAAIASKKGKLEATRIATQVAKFFCILFVIVGIFGIGNMGSNFFLAAIGVYIYFAGKQEYRMVILEQQANRYSGFRDGEIDVEVSPPPYARSAQSPGGTNGLLEKLKNLFKA